MLQRTAKSCGPDAPTLASSSRSRVGPTGLDKTYPLMTVAKEPDHRGARRKPLKPLRAGTSGDSGVLVYSCAFLPMQSAHEAAGATGTRRSPRPLFYRAEDLCTTRAHRAAGRRLASEIRATSLRANGSRECAPDDRLREAIHLAA